MPYKNRKDQLAAQQRHYLKKKDYYVAKARERDLRLKEWAKELKENCTKCGESHPACLEYHHRDQFDKEFNLSEAVQRGWGKERILLEIEKCDILCANCHRKVHWETRGLNKQYLNQS